MNSSITIDDENLLKTDVVKIMRTINQNYKNNEFKQWATASSKIEFALELLDNLRKEGHKVLFFSKTKILLNLIEHLLNEKEGYKYLRLDGDVKISDREAICQKFNTDPCVNCFLLTSQVSGVGLNLVSANRAIIIDPDWNPANDNQSIDRCYRIGQKRDVIVYRLISTNTVEDKIYKRQVFKSSISKACVEDAEDNMIRYFDEGEFKDLLKYDISTFGCETLKNINRRHELSLPDVPSMNLHRDYLESLEQVEGISNHGMLFSGTEEISPEDDKDLEAKVHEELHIMNQY